jgi:hypothetical protein
MSIDNLKPSDLFCNVFSAYDYNGLTMQELLSQFFTKINEIVTLTNNTKTNVDEKITSFEDVLDYLKDIGLKAEVVEKMEIWFNDGTLTNIINNSIFTDINTKIDNMPVIIKPTNTVNDSTNINALLLNGGNFLIKKGEYNIVEDIQVKSNTTLRFEKGAIFKKTSTDRTLYYVINIDSVDNVEIFNPQIIGDRLIHIGEDGEWGHGINIMHSNNVVIHDADIKNCWGDGIYIGNDYYIFKSKKTDNIKIVRPLIDNVRRNGISVCSGKLIEIIDPVIKNVNGAAPQAGIDIEPEGIANIIHLENLIITNPVTENCNLGITGYLAQLDGKESIIDIKNHKDIGSGNGFALFNCMANVKGVFNYENCILMNNYQKGISIGEYGLNMPTLKIKNPTIINCNVANGSEDIFSSAIYHFSNTIVEDVGNFEIENANIVDTRYPKQMKNGIYLVGNTLKKVKIINPKRLDGYDRQINIYATESMVVDDYNVTTNEDTYSGGIDINTYDFRSKRKTTNSVDSIVYNLKTVPHQSAITFEKTGNHRLNIVPQTGNKITPLGTTNQFIYTDQIGAKITLLPLSNGDWTVENIIGVWNIQ